MARFTAPSLWLPGFDPEPVETTESPNSILEMPLQAADVSVRAVLWLFWGMLGLCVE